MTLARDACALVEGPLLPEFEGAWIDERRRELEEVRLELIETIARAALQLGVAEGGTAERAARLLIAREPYRESAYALLMQAHALRGDAAEGLRVYDRLRVLLRDELGVAPSATVSALHGRLLRHGEAPASRPSPSRTEHVAVPFPGLLARSEQKALVGRREPRERLSRWWQEGRDEGALILVAGDAGIGKTRLAARLGAEAHAAGATVLYGRAEEETVVPYQPLVEALRHYARHCPGLREDAALAPHRGELARIVPELAHPERPSDGEELADQRYRLFEAVVALLGHAAARGPLLLVLEDLHWADKPTLLLLKQVIRHTEHLPATLLATYRDAEVGDSLARMLSDVRRERVVRRIPLDGLSEEDTGALVQAHTHAAASPAFARGVFAHTAGNPFFIEETLRDLSELPGAGQCDRLPASLAVPEGVKEVIGRRVGRLSPETVHTLTTAAVLGREFRLDALQAVTRSRQDELLAALEEGVDAGLIMEHVEHADRFAFCHALVREALHERPSASRRRRVHLAAAAALEAARERLEIPAAELAWHFYEAREIGGAEKAVEHCLEAARRAAASRAYEDAARHYEHALRALEFARGEVDAVRCDVLLALGGARWQAGEPGARAAFERAAEVARRLRSPDRLARAALGAGGRFYAPVAADDGYIVLLTEALEALGRVDTPLRARVLARLAQSIAIAEPGGRAAILAREAVAVAEGLDDTAAVPVALMSLHAALLHVAHADQRVDVATRARDAAVTAGLFEVAALAGHWLVFDLLEIGRLDEADRVHGELEQLAGELQQPLYRHSALAWRCVRAQLAGRFQESERLARESLRLAERAGAPDAQRHFVAQLFVLRREQGRLGELVGEIARLAGPGPGALLWQAALPLAHLDAGDVSRARDAYDRVAADRHPTTMFWLPVAAMLGEAAAALHDAEGVEHYYGLLLPYAGRLIQAGFAGNLGCVHRVLGLLAVRRSDRQAACAHLECALEVHTALGAPPLVARTQTDLAEVLLSGGTRAERARATWLLASALGTAEALGMTGLAARVGGTRQSEDLICAQ